MHLRAFAVLAALLAASPARAQTATDCRSAAQAFEQTAQLPSGLLLAIGQVESGRINPATGQVDPWPWATNHAGEGHYFASAQEAIAWVTAQQAAGNRSIDIGCFQVNLHYHPDAFASLAEAFEPAANARYAASLLNELHARSGSWPAAIALYHSSDPFEGQQYGSRVIAAWNNGGAALATGPRNIGAWSADPVVVRLAAAASLVRVELPGAAARPATAFMPPRTGLPRVFTPSR